MNDSILIFNIGIIWNQDKNIKKQLLWKIYSPKFSQKAKMLFRRVNFENFKNRKNVPKFDSFEQIKTLAEFFLGFEFLGKKTFSQPFRISK